ncbi:LysR family transcriptional regulator [Arthrobacter sp. H14-L1]|uniref:LysR family transcriptional regulator n=1 Tax=Arthrobacter sp. H14-L1 TaxID=2996697 RepID=UPI002270EEC0|nr:LysR family transcriptional regulator [Arthrobacter sp. H14-L1]MCY0906384.1 LysR family transcriptional regulator [Arthrobacter sp. H14-L1]
METRRLQYFLAVAEELHFGRAALFLHVSQPALSQQINILERELGARLLNRTTREVSLTRLGVAVAQQAKVFAASETDVRERIADLVSGRQGYLRVGFVPSAAYDLLPRIVAPFSREHPDVRLSLQEMPSQQQIELVLNGQMDLGLVRDVSHARGTSLIPLVREKLILACPDRHPLAASEKVSLSALQSERFIVLPKNVAPAMSRTISALCHRAGIDLSDAMEVLAFPTTLGLVASGMGVAIVPASVRATVLPGLVYRELTEDNATSQFSAVLREGGADQLTQHFLNIAGRAIAGRALAG